MSEFYVNKIGTLEYLCAESLRAVPHGFSTRLGGVSEGCLASLNLGTQRGDTRENVLENYRRFASAVGFRTEDMVFSRQVHGDFVARVGRKNCGEGLHIEVPEARDGLMTDEPNVVLTIFSADCTPILLFDPVRRAVAAVHAGWRGTALGIAGRVVERMREEFGCKPEHLRAAIGPCIGKCCFETDADVPEAMLRSVGDEAQGYIEPHGEKYTVDLKGINALWLRRAGVKTVQISDDCTSCLCERYWSHRRTRGHRGAQAAVILLREERK